VSGCDAANRRAEQSLMRPSSHHITTARDDSAHDAELRSITRRTENMRRDAAAQEHSLASTMSQQKSLSSRLPSESVVTAQYNRSQQQMDQATKGMDILIMMDCTGSMVQTACAAIDLLQHHACIIGHSCKCSKLLQASGISSPVLSGSSNVHNVSCCLFKLGTDSSLCMLTQAWAIASCKRQIKAVLEKVQNDYPEAMIRVVRAASCLFLLSFHAITVLCLTVMPCNLSAAFKMCVCFMDIPCTPSSLHAYHWSMPCRPSLGTRTMVIQMSEFCSTSLWTSRTSALWSSTWARSWLTVELTAQKTLREPCRY